MATVNELHDHLKASGTGQAKLDAVKSCSSVAEAMAALDEFPGTKAKAAEFVGRLAPAEPAAPPQPAKPARFAPPAAKRSTASESHDDANS